ncbi:MAG: 3-hydroxybutyryl-CoA dehydrogenase [Ignavibacteria bacterium GWB2_36_8]|nr:MAG: 3-hydroxybutyryl-CoA dehydrogenase [Ignavibacteria bacterium GWB2_36_8]OGU53609.1 MAG: 3-hydroxybutyryl-CoA dehydrogenase [Ignavibacteria bacterium GWC2_36_12]OGV01959.1 MAG: 3-hydroxybutyryl-CoA dehydrogenase [Ignavibacteria bacterium RIFOXYB2_FULL_36_7]
MKNISVIGGGTMGNGIAHVFALKGFNVNLIEMNDELAKKALTMISINLDRQIKKNIINETEKSKTLNNIKAVVGVENIQENTDLVIEAIVENKDAKLSVFNRLKAIIKSDSIFASNTSSISITELSSSSNRPDKFIGMHFMNPVPVMKLIEIIRGYETSDETYNAIKDLTLRLDKVPVQVQDYPGFISNRILMPMINEAIFALMENVASAEDIDAVMKLGMSHPMGPLTLADFIGLDVCLAILNVLYDGFNDPKYRPCPLLKKMVAAGKLGRKSGEGFYKY